MRGVTNPLDSGREGTEVRILSRVHRSGVQVPRVRIKCVVSLLYLLLFYNPPFLLFLRFSLFLVYFKCDSPFLSVGGKDECILTSTSGTFSLTQS